MINELPVLEARNVAFSFGDNPVLVDVSFSVAPGEFVALVGSNGSGKSTLLRCLLGVLSPSEGQAFLFGQFSSSVEDKWQVGYVPQRPFIHTDLPVTVREVVETGRLSRRGVFRRLNAVDKEAISSAIEDVGLSDHGDSLVKELSGGQQQRVFVARALAAEPRLLILDEPVAGVDLESQETFRDVLVHMVKEHATAVLLVSHELGAVANDLNRVVVLRDGRVAFDAAPSELEKSGVSLGVHHEDLPLWLEGRPQ